MKQKRKKYTSRETEQRFDELLNAIQAELDQINQAKKNQSEAKYRAMVEQ